MDNKFYWPDLSEKQLALCMACGNDIDFNFEVGIMVIKEDITLEEAERNKGRIDINVFCSECGTNLELLHSLGFKRMIGTLEDPGKRDELKKIIGGRN